MIDFSDVAERIRSTLVGGGIKAKNIIMYNNEGNSTTQPNKARSFYVSSPNMMILLLEPNFSENNENSLLQCHYYTGKNDEQALQIYKNLKKIAGEYMINVELAKDTKEIKPVHFAEKFKSKGQVMENVKIEPSNPLWAAKVLKVIKKFKNPTEYTIADDLGVDFDQLKPVLNDLVKKGKLSVIKDSQGSPVYSIKVEETVMENFSKMFGTMKTSRQTFENVKILVKHRKPVNEEIRGSRARYISAIFLECNGERFKFKENYLPGARAMARHLAHGGLMSDKVGNYITESTTQLLKLQSFNRYVTTNKLINEDSSGIIDIIKENINNLKTEIKKLSGVKTYEAVKARIETFERENLSEADVSDLKELFTIKRFDEKFEEVLPIVKQLVQEQDSYHRRIEEAAANSVRIRKENINLTPVLEFTSENAKLGYKISELSAKILENSELSEFVGKVGSKISRNSEINAFERAILEQVFQNLKVVEDAPKKVSEICESVELEKFFDKFDYRFL